MPAERWIEPAARLPLRWGHYRDRVLAGLVLIVTGLVHLQAASTLNLVPLAVGTAAHLAGWMILPASVGRRLGPAGPSALVVWLLLTGPQSMWALIVPFVGWLVARHRPWRSFLAVTPVLLYGVLAIAVFGEYDQQVLALGLGGVVLCGSAWWAWALARPAPAARTGTPPTTTPPTTASA